jgi:hypothetical protein
MVPALWLEAAGLPLTPQAELHHCPKTLFSIGHFDPAGVQPELSVCH